MADQTTGWEMQERERRAEHVLAAYRERRRTRRGDDTWFGAAEGLLEDADHGLDPEGASHRRAEEGLDPVLAVELVRCGLGIFPPEAGLENAPDEPTTDKYRPTWLEPPIPPDEQLRERTLRVSFRRLRGLLERHAEDADAAFRAFGREPDAGPVGY
jgi:hypothetical protein